MPDGDSRTPSQRAVEAAYGYYADHAGGTVEDALAAAYPIIRADVIAEVVEALRVRAATVPEDEQQAIYFAAGFIEREFGGADA